MPQDTLRGAVDAVRARLQAELDAQLAVIVDQHADALAEAQRTAESEADQRWSEKLEAVRAEWNSRLESELETTRSDAERRLAEETTRARAEAEKSAEESAARLREELEAAIAERQRVEDELAAERERARQEIERQRDELHELQKLQAQGQAQPSAAVVEARASERQAQLAGLDRLLESVHAISAAQSLSDTLGALLAAVAAEAPRAAIFIVDGERLQSFKSAGFGASSSVTIATGEVNLLHDALRRGAAVTTESGGGPAAPSFASLAADRAGLAVPIVVGDRAVAVLYADDGGDAVHEVPASWPESVQILGRHASACLAYLTAVRSAQAMRMATAMGARGTQGSAADAPDSVVEDEGGAQRYARLLVSEIKLYNEAAVQTGRQKRDLLTRLRPEIERARRLYEQRVPSAIPARGTFFQQELVRTLADGDPALLGG